MLNLRISSPGQSRSQGEDWLLDGSVPEETLFIIICQIIFGQIKKSNNEIPIVIWIIKIFFKKKI